MDSLPKAIDSIEPPLHIRIKPTNVCAHNRWYSVYRADNIQLGNDMVAKILFQSQDDGNTDDLVDMGKQKPGHSKGRL